MASAGEIRRKFEERLLQDWHSLAIQLEIPEATKFTWDNGKEAAGIWVWLESRERLADLADALDAVGRGDLADQVRKRPDPGNRNELDEPPSPRGVPATAIRVVIRRMCTRWRLVMVPLVLAPALFGGYRLLFPESREKQLLPGETYDLSNVSPLYDLYPTGVTTGIRSLIAVSESLADTGSFGVVFTSHVLDHAMTRPRVEAEVRNARGDLANSPDDQIEIHWIAPDRDHDLAQRAVPRLPLRNGAASDQHPGTTPAGTRVAVIYYYPEFREHPPQINVWIH